MFGFVNGRVGHALLGVSVAHLAYGAYRFRAELVSVLDESLPRLAPLGEAQGYALWFMHGGVFLALLGWAVRELEARGGHPGRGFAALLAVSALADILVTVKSGFWLLLLLALAVFFAHESEAQS